MPKIHEYPLQISLNHGLIVVYIPHFSRTLSVFYANYGKATQSILSFLKSSIIRSNYTLQNWVYFKKQASYSLKVPKTSLNIKKSPKKEEKAVLKHSLHLLFPMFSGLFSFYSTQIQSTYDIS